HDGNVRLGAAQQLVDFGGGSDVDTLGRPSVENERILSLVGRYHRPDGADGDQREQAGDKKNHDLAAAQDIENERDVALAFVELRRIRRITHAILQGTAHEA